MRPWLLEAFAPHRMFTAHVAASRSKTSFVSPEKKGEKRFFETALEPFLLVENVYLLEFGLRLGKVNDALDNGDDGHNDSGGSKSDKAGRNGNGKHYEAGGVVSQIEFVDTERPKENSEQACCHVIFGIGDGLRVGRLRVGGLAGLLVGVCRLLIRVRLTERLISSLTGNLTGSLIGRLPVRRRLSRRLLLICRLAGLIRSRLIRARIAWLLISLR